MIRVFAAKAKYEQLKLKLDQSLRSNSTCEVAETEWLVSCSWSKSEGEGSETECAYFFAVTANVIEQKLNDQGICTNSKREGIETEWSESCNYSKCEVASTDQSEFLQ
jgi:hypothetical protein